MSSRYYGNNSRHNSGHHSSNRPPENNDIQQIKQEMKRKCEKRIKIINTFRSLWEEHGFWTRSFIISAAHKLPDLKYVTQRLLRNPDDFGAALQEFYSKEQSDRFRKLLRDHLVIASRIVDNAKAGDTRGVA